MTQRVLRPTKYNIFTALYFSLFVRRSPMCNQPSINKATLTGKKDLGDYSSHI